MESGTATENTGREAAQGRYSTGKGSLNRCVYKYLIYLLHPAYKCATLSVLKVLIHTRTPPYMVMSPTGGMSVLQKKKGGSRSMIVLDCQDRKPLYKQVVEKFRYLILNGALKPGEKMPSVRQLAMDLSINPNTIQRAYMQLEQEGLIYPVKGKGNFIADSEDVRKASIESYKRELKALIQKGKAIGIEEEELIYIIRECYKEEMP